jgi:hypothetical protein
MPFSVINLLVFSTHGNIIQERISREYHGNHENDAGGYGCYPVKAIVQPEAAIRLFDYCASFDGVELLYNGIEGEDWNMVNGTPVFTDEIVQGP